MGKPTGFKEFTRQTTPYRSAKTRMGDYGEIYTVADESLLKIQGARCMDCGVPFCHSDTGCPVDNLIPEWNDLVYNGRWREASSDCMRPIIFQSLPAESVQHLVKARVFWE